jgi:putative ABC transport system permease protein
VSLLAVKLRRDLRASWSRFALMIIAIAVSLVVFGGVLIGWATIGRETAGAYSGTEPPSATIVLDQDIPAEQLAAIAARAKSQPGVIESSARTQFVTDVQINGQPQDINMQVYVAAPDDPMRMAKFQVDGGETWPPGPGEIYIREDSLALLGVAVGDTASVETPGGERVQLRFSGTVYDPSLSPSPQEQRANGYLSSASLAAAGEPVLMDQLKIQVAEPGQTTATRDRDTVVAVAGNVGQWVQREYGLTVREVQVPRPHAHPHQWQADSILLALLAGGAAALLLSTILVASMLRNLFTQQIPQIGIMKAIGARSGRIAGFYLSMTLLVAAAATLIALPFAILIGRYTLGLFTGFLGIEPVSATAPWWTILVIIAVGLGLPPLMALFPLVKASRTTVRAAIDHHGGGSNPSSTSGLLARLSRWRILDRGLLMALRNTVRRPARFWLSVSLLASAGMVFVAGMSLTSGTSAIDEERKVQRNWDVDVALTAPAGMAEVTALVGRLPNVSKVEGWSRTQTGVAGPGEVPVTRTYPDQGHGGVSVTAVPAGTTMLPTPKLLEGRWLNPGEKGAIVLNQIARANTVPNAKAGDSVQLVIDGKSSQWKVVGLVEEREGGSGGLYTTAEGFAAAVGKPKQVTQLRVATTSHDEPTRQAVADDITKALTGSGVVVSSSVSVSRSDAISAGHLGPVIFILLGVALPLGVIGAIGLASTMSANILDRTREFGIMHAIGAQPRSVHRIVVAEGIFLAVTSCLVAAIPAVGLTALLGAGLGNLFLYAPLPFRISWLAVLIWLGLVIFGGILATEAAASRASRITVREALAYI